MRRIILLTLAFPIIATAGQYYYTLNGDRFVQMMSPPDPKGYEYLNREKAYSYLDGVRDASEGEAWCDVGQRKTPDLAYELADEIEKMSAAERKKSAAVLLRQQLKRHYPCRNGKKS